MIESWTVLPRRLEAAPAPPGDPPLDLLDPFERRAFAMMDWLFTRTPRFGDAWLRYVSEKWMTLGSWRMVVPRGLERLRGLTPSDRILLVANHRSFFDLYMLLVQLHRHLGLYQPIMCPVRGDFFYERPAGVAVTLLVGGGRMYPPVFRQPEKAEFNKWALARVVDFLRRGPAIVGFHPEGRRNKGPDPYTPLPAQPGVGRLVMETWPIVVPAFIHGMSSDFMGDIVANFRDQRRCIAVFGEPVDLTPFRGMSNRLATHKRIADRLLETIYRLGDEERAVRAEIGNPRGER